MTSQNSNQNKNPYLDKLLDWYDKSKLQDQNEIQLQKENFVKSLKTCENLLMTRLLLIGFRGGEDDFHASRVSQKVFHLPRV